MVLAFLFGTAAGAPQPPDLTGTWTPTTGGAWVLTASGPGLNHLHAEWQGTGTHSHLHGTFDGTLNSAGNAYSGSFSVTEDTTHVSGAMTFTIGSSDHLAVTLPGSMIVMTRSGGAPSGGRNEVHVVAIQPDCQFHKGGSPADAWLPLEKNTVMKQGDEITCDPDGTATLAFADNSTVVVRNVTQLKIASFFTEGGIVKTEVLLKMGEVAAQVNKSAATKSDFKIKSPTDVSSVRGTIFTVFADPVGKASITSVKQGVVEVDPNKPGLPTTNVPAGKEIDVTSKTESPIAPIGKADARGGVDREHALRLVDSAIRRLGRACNLSPSHFGAGIGVKPSGPGWLVSILVAGGVKGWSAWQVTGSKVTPANALAKTIAAGCKGASPPPSTTGVHPSVTFTQNGSPVGQAITAPTGADGLIMNMDPHTGVLANGSWTSGGKAVGALGGVPAGATGALFTTSAGANPGTPIVRPPAATSFHVTWNTSGVITSAAWFSVGKPLATIPLASGQKAIAFTNGTG